MNKKNLSAQISKQPIGIFDSGVGGLSVLQELEKMLPNENFVFLADQKNVPYGEKTKAELIKLVYKITDYFVKNHDIKMMVVACNTATCGAIKELRAKYPLLPIVGTVPAIKVAAEKTKTGTIACIATPSTSKSERVKEIIRDNCQNVNVLNIGCKHLENAVETGELNGGEVNKLLQKYLKKVKESDADYLVLGCTHYPFLKKTIHKMLGSGVKLIDGGKGIAKRAKSLLHANRSKNNQKNIGKNLYFTTSDPLKFSQVSTLLLKKQIKAGKVVI